MLHGDSVTERKSDTERSQILAVEITNFVSRGYRVEWQGSYRALLARRKEPNHFVHLFLTLFTGIWLFVWIIRGITKGFEGVLVTVDEWGNLRHETVSAKGN